MECRKDGEFEGVVQGQNDVTELDGILEEIEVEDLTVDGICGVY